MLKPPVTVTVLVIIVLAVLLPLLGQEHWLVGVIAGLAFAVGAWCAPASFSAGSTGSLLTMSRETWTERMARTKSLQLLAGAIAVLGLVMLNVFDGGTAAIIGIAVAMGIGAVGGSGDAEKTSR